MSALLSREAILKANDLKTERVSVPEWGGDVLISTMTGAQRDAWEQTFVASKAKEGKPDLTNVRARLVVFCAVDDKGQPLFQDSDVIELTKRSGVALERCAKVAQRLNFLTDRELEGEVKN